MITKKIKSLFLISLLLFILFYSSAISYILADSSSSGRELFFGPPILGLEGTGLTASKSQEGMVPLNKASLAGGQQEIIHFSLDISQVSLNIVRSKDYVKIEGLKPYGNPGEPQLPFKSFIVTLPLNSEVSGVNVSGVSYRPVLNKLDIISNPVPVSSIKINRIVNQGEKQIKGAVSRQITNEGQTTSGTKSFGKCKTCDSETFLPGNLVSYDTYTDNNNRYVFIKFFPMQYISGTGRAILISNADITVNYQFADSKQTTE